MSVCRWAAGLGGVLGWSACKDCGGRQLGKRGRRGNEQGYGQRCRRSRNGRRHQRRWSHVYRRLVGHQRRARGWCIGDGRQSLQLLSAERRLLGDSQVAHASADAQEVQAKFNLATARAKLLRALGRE
jgi:hypothetical protein